jgi:small-conductance mechanosensitive channel
MSLIQALAIVVGALVVVAVGQGASYFVLRRRAKAPRQAVARSFLRNTHRPVQLLLPLAAATVAANLVPLAGWLRGEILHGLVIGLILAGSWLLVRLTYVLEDAVLARYQLDPTGNLRARQLETEIHVLRRVTVFVGALIGIGGVLLTFSQARVAGAGLLASAGVVGLIVGLAVTPIVTSLVAGLQIAVTQPIRLDDVVVIYNPSGTSYWGRVEEIHLTYVVVKLWDLKRLVVPVSYLTQNPFENWTRSTANVLGFVYILVDYTMSVEALRTHLGEVVHASPDWDGQVWNLQVTELGRETVQLRALMSSADSSRSWNLQCEVREKALAFLQERYPSALPRVRAELGWAGGDGEMAHREAPARPHK